MADIFISMYMPRDIPRGFGLRRSTPSERRALGDALNPFSKPVPEVPAPRSMERSDLQIDVERFMAVGYLFNIEYDETERQ